MRSTGPGSHRVAELALAPRGGERAAGAQSSAVPVLSCVAPSWCVPSHPAGSLPRLSGSVDGREKINPGNLGFILDGSKNRGVSNYLVCSVAEGGL